jgi:hypothetical protein
MGLVWYTPRNPAVYVQSICIFDALSTGWPSPSECVLFVGLTYDSFIPEA